MTDKKRIIETDYLIVGAGATGMAFADILVEESDYSMVIVDRNAKPGGHWNMAYPFVRLHQPSQFYGVSSKELSKGIKDRDGYNEGLYELASGTEVQSYYDDLMNQQFIPSGRVEYFPMHEYEGEGCFSSMLTGERYEVKVRKKIVNATYLTNEVPATHTPNFSIDPSVTFIPINDLPNIDRPPEGFVIIGGGKTGIDACLWLLQQNVDPDKITWIVSRDAWLLDRNNVQPAQEFFHNTMGGQVAQFKAVAIAKSIAHLFELLESYGVLVRIDRSIQPTMFHGATVSQKELEALRRVKNVIRKGRVVRLEKDQIVFNNDSIPTSPKHIHVDCSATPIRSDLKMVPIFQGNTITPQTVRSYQPTFSSAFIAHIELQFDDEKEKNRICQVVPLPNHDTDWIRMLAVLMANQITWSQYKDLRTWLTANRLDGFANMIRSVSQDDTEKQMVLRDMKKYSMQAFMNMPNLLAELDRT